MEFGQFKKIVQEQITRMLDGATHLFQTGVDKDALWETYIESFAPEHNKMFRERREHDCSACRQFIRNFGGVVAIKDNQIMTIWDIDVDVEEYTPSVKAMKKLVLSQEVSDIFLSPSVAIGVDMNEEKNEKSGVIFWEHLYTKLPKCFVAPEITIPQKMAEVRDIRNVFKRSLVEISQDSVETVLDLIAQKSLYKGEEWQGVLNQFIQIQKEHDKLADIQKEKYYWTKSLEVGPVIGKIRNHSMGTLLTNISEGMDLNIAVKKYEEIVAPHNYKRPAPVFTKKMIDAMEKQLQEDDLIGSLQRRHATLEDITVNNIIFHNQDVAQRVKGSVFDVLKGEVSDKNKSFDKAEEIDIEKFIKDVLPNVTNIELLLENGHIPNLVSLIAPENIDAKTLFKWANGFSWAYNGNITDSEIAQRVRAAGGRTDVPLRFSHSWNYDGMRNGSLMDLHVFLPGSDQEIRMVDGKEIHDFYGNGCRVGWNHRLNFQTGGSQDVDYVNVAPPNYIPVENIIFPSMSKLEDGVYVFKIHNWRLRQPTNGGFKAEIAFGGQVYSFTHKAPLAHKEWITLAKLELKNGQFHILEMMENDTTPITIWGLQTNKFIPVTVMMFSPNYWDEQKGIGHKHYFFMLNGCENDTSPSGFFNEFLREEFMKHKKAFAALGDKMRVEPCDDQLSGVGFSSTKRNSIVCRVSGKFTRILKIKF